MMKSLKERWSLFVLLGCFWSVVQAQTWNGGGADNNWSTGANWAGGVVPANPFPGAGTANVIFDGALRLAPNMDVNWDINSLTFNSTAGAFTIGASGGVTQLGLENGITDNSANTEIINAPFVLGIASLSQTFTTAAGGSLVISGPMDWFGSALTVDGAGNTTFSGVGSDSGPGATLTKNGTGTLTLSNSNAYTGGTTINAGTVIAAADNALSNAGTGTQVNTGGTLAFQGGIAYSTAEPVTLNGTGAAGRSGAIDNISGINSFPGLITLASASTIGSSAGTLTLSGNVVNGGFLLTTGGAGNLNMSGVVSGSGGLTQNGSGTVTLSGASANTFTGATTINNGTLQFNKTAGINAITGALTIGDGVGAANTAVVQFLASNQMPTSTTPTILNDGLLDLNGFNQGVAGLNITGGNVSTGIGALTLAGNVTGNASASTATLSGNLNLNGGTRTFTIASGTASPDMAVSAVISNGGLTKAGTGNLLLTGNNTYAGTTTVSAGSLIVGANNALGTTAGATTVSSGGTLAFQGGVNYTTTEAVTLRGTGATGRAGAIDNISGINSFSGPITLASASTIGSSAGTLTLNGNVANGGFLLTTGGAGNTTMNGVISGTGGLTKTGTGTTTLSGAAANTFTGATTVNAGILSLAANGALSRTSSLAINTGGIVSLDGGAGTLINSAAGIALGGGAFRNNVNQSETLGNLTMSSSSTIVLLAGGSTLGQLKFSNASFSPTGLLTVNNWSGSPWGNSVTGNEIFFSSAMRGATFTSSQIQFAGFSGGAYVLGSGQLCPIPEPRTLWSGLLIASLLLLRVGRKRKKTQ